MLFMEVKWATEVLFLRAISHKVSPGRTVYVALADALDVGIRSCSPV